jgi:AraC-like DNA-binding protein
MVWRVPQILEILGMLSIFVLGLAINLAFLRVNPAFALTRAVATPENPATDDPLLGELTRLMTEERLYADHDLRIGSLAARLNMPEYRLRRVINQQLGYQNFNQFINGYRIEEAARRLRSEPRSPILTIALDVGFRSISSFNVAFRTRYGRSPSQIRAESLTET